MRLATLDSFLTKGSGQIPAGKYYAVGIHSSSEVESFDMGGVRVGVKSVAPLGGQGGQLVKSVRNTMVSGVALSELTGAPGPLDGVKKPGEKLTLQLYEECDDAVQPPGPRAPYVTECVIPTTIGATAGAATLVAALPMSGRLRASLNFNAGSLNANLSVGIRGVRCDTLNVKGFYYRDSPAQTVLQANAALYGSAAGLTQDGVIYVDNESFDYLLIYVFTAVAPSTSFNFLGEVTGERLQ